MKPRKTRSTQGTLIAMKKQLIERCLKRRMLWKDAATILQMHAKALSRLKRCYLEFGDAALLGRKPGPKTYSPPVNKTDESIKFGHVRGDFCLVAEAVAANAIFASRGRGDQ